jgi:hypothetical protein
VGVGDGNGVGSGVGDSVGNIVVVEVIDISCEGVACSAVVEGEATTGVLLAPSASIP